MKNVERKKKYVMLTERYVLFHKEMENVLYFMEMTYLNHKSFDYAMEDHIVVVSVPR